MRLLIGGIVGPAVVTQMRFAVASLAFLLALLAFASAARAEQRYAAPTGAGTTCTQAAPCLLEEAVSKAESGDEVIVGSGTHTVSETAFVNPGVENVSIHGDLSGPVPKVEGSVGGPLIEVTGAGSRISRLEVTNTLEGSAGISCGAGARVERVTASALGAFAVGIFVRPDCTVTDSVARTVGGSSIALWAIGGGGKASATNVTALADGVESIGVMSLNSNGSGSGSGDHALDLRNSIARGAAVDLSTSADPGGTDTLLASHSNFDTTSSEGEAKVIDGGGNQGAPPIFADVATSDYREVAGSPTIDAGVLPASSLDLSGNPRVSGSAPDIGAYEFQSPAGGAGKAAPGPGARIQSLTIEPNAFRAANFGGAFLSAGRLKAPVGATVGYVLSAPSMVGFTIERRFVGRRAGKKCLKRNPKNGSKPKCSSYKLLPGSFIQTGVSGQNSFKFSGRLRSALRPGAYRLTGRTGTSSRTTGFRIVK